MYERRRVPLKLGIRHDLEPSHEIDALNAGYRYLEVKCDGCGTHNTVDLTTIRRPATTPIWQLEQRMRCKPCRSSAASAGMRYGCGAAKSRRKTTASRGISGDQRDQG
jgi:hypothetical protein